MNQTKIAKDAIVASWVKSYADELFSWAAHKVSDTPLAEDLVQETFLSAFKAFDSFKGDSNPKTWLFRILNNKIIDHYRKAANHQKHELNEEQAEKYSNSFFDSHNNWKANGLEERWDDESNLLDNPEFEQTMELCVDNLPEKWKVALTGKYLHSKESKDICQELKITSSNYWQMLHRAKLLLKSCLEKHWFAHL